MKQVVLVIDDNVGVRDNISEILTLSNYSVLNASNGNEGLDMAQKNAPDIILCDVMMPELDGYGVLSRLNDNPKTSSIPFVFVSAKSDKQDFRKGMDYGVDDYLAKPFTGDDLLSLVNTRLKKSTAFKKTIANDLSNVNDVFKKPMPIDNIYEISDKIVSKKLGKKSVLFSEGDSSKYIHYIVSGKIKTFKTNEQGKEYVTQIYKVKDFFGYSSLLESNIYEETAVAIEDTEVASILKSDFYPLLLSNNNLSAKFTQVITSDLTVANDKLIKLAYNSARKRVSEALLFLAKKYYDELTDNLSFPICRDDISSISGVSPESVSRNLTDLRIEQLIELQAGKVKILNVKKLTDIKN